MSLIRQCSVKSLAELTQEWDRLAAERHRQISSGEDLSFHHVVVPATWGLFNGSENSTVLDIGSGTGDFTVELARLARKVIAVEPSRANMAIARRVCQRVSNIQFVEAYLENAANMLGDAPVTAAVAVMTLMTVPDIRGFARALARILQPGSRFSAVITHPCFWPRYWGYEREPWFHYKGELFVEAPFAISKCRTEIRTTHVHRPVEQYIEVFAEAGFRLDSLVEPIPAPEVEALYPAPWEFPRFLGLRWENARP